MPIAAVFRVEPMCWFSVKWRVDATPSEYSANSSGPVSTAACGTGWRKGAATQTATGLKGEIGLAGPRLPQGALGAGLAVKGRAIDHRVGVHGFTSQAVFSMKGAG
jgi:hypothetical protein